jgi:UDP-3-O-[3-hydroxymyristoyl] glucosamine N-acyltransferase
LNGAAVGSEEWGIPLPAPVRVGDLSRDHGGTLDGGVDGRIVRRVVSIEHARAVDELAVMTVGRFAKECASTAAVVLCQENVASRCPAGKRWVHAHAMYVVARLLSTDDSEAGRVHPEAHVDPEASVAPTALVHRGAVVRAGACVGPHSVIGEGAVVYGGVRMGARVTIGPLAVLGRPGFGWATGPGGDVLRVPQRGGVVIEDDVEVGALATIDAGTLGPTILRRGVKLDAHVHVGHNVVIGENTMVAAQAGFAGSARISSGVLVGGQAGVTDHAFVGVGARIAAKSGVIGDVAAGQVVAGFPAVPRASWWRAWAKLLGEQKARKR